MKELRPVGNMATLELHTDLCAGCDFCIVVCPQGDLAREGPEMRATRQDNCLACGGCARNCPVASASAKPGVGCAAYILSGWGKVGTP
ncbi:4Fe-4S dicluster domain-containing protein [Desulfoluna butyratoxydans]|uniref:4fe-4s ferredoxin-type iron-sulphur binding domain n=1 Tax=Desulfoluna butyratoxydans TaxID=231438 RepID=A0A4U8YUN3_9BACT|nr:4Fe-4S dicluster domain-containing protein [Desulfoluna butyratoxydans]VFQ45612.1 4fe-4s ferredoxin-type iron-sulphur binding domain [Desulfoluna butyratoxydans]